MAIGTSELASAELRGFDDDRLVDELRKSKEELFNLRFQSATGQQEKGTVATAEERNYRKTRQGYVVSGKMDKTVVVEVEDRVKHPLYGKVIRRSTKIKAHDEANAAGVGDRVLIMETRPLSATKHWRLVEILERAK